MKIDHRACRAGRDWRRLMFVAGRRRRKTRLSESLCVSRSVEGLVFRCPPRRRQKDAKFYF